MYHVASQYAVRAAFNFSTDYYMANAYVAMVQIKSNLVILPVQKYPLCTATPPLGKINPSSKIAVTFEPIMRL